MFPLGDSTKAQVRAEATAPRARGRRQARLARHLLHRRRRHPRLPGRGGSARRRADRRRRRPARRRRARGRVRLHRRAAPRACTASPGRRRRAALRAVHPARPTTPWWSARASCWTSTRSHAAPPVWTAGRAGVEFECDVQLRAHGTVTPAAVTRRRRRRSSPGCDGTQRGVAAGQALVIYDGDTVLGSATDRAPARARLQRPTLHDRRVPVAARRGDRDRVAARHRSGRGGRASSFGELPDLPYLPELPARGPGAELIGRSAALLVDLPVEIVPSGWRLTAAPRPRPAPGPGPARPRPRRAGGGGRRLRRCR